MNEQRDQWRLTTAAGRHLLVRATPDEYGRVVYDVAKIGAFTLSYDLYSYRPDPQRPRGIYVRYGREEGPLRYNAQDLPDRPVVCTVELGGAAVFRAQNMNPSSRYWLNVERHRSHADVPDGTARRTAEIVHALVVDWLARDDHEELAGYLAWHLAPRRIGHAEETIDRLTRQQAKVLAELADQCAFRDRQLAIRGQAPAPPPRRPDPRHPDGQAIAWLHAELDRLCQQHHRPEHVPAGAVVTILAGWLDTLGLAIPAWALAGDSEAIGRVRETTCHRQLGDPEAS